jgi:superfamily I DNA/RNA helicase
MFEIELTRRYIPFVKFGGIKFIEAAHIKDMLSVLRWAENRADRVTGFRVLQLLEVSDQLQLAKRSTAWRDDRRSTPWLVSDAGKVR